MIRIGYLYESKSTTFGFIGEISGRPTCARVSTSRTKGEHLEVFVLEPDDLASLKKCKLPGEIEYVILKHTNQGK